MDHIFRIQRVYTHHFIQLAHCTLKGLDIATSLLLPSPFNHLAAQCQLNHSTCMLQGACRNNIVQSVAGSSHVATGQEFRSEQGLSQIPMCNMGDVA
ncbi:MAG: hypothetical protein CMB23_00685 [Euryarchaeota archaeon]|nr:hypothetical protein [Euryarchaeota archaeon]